MKIKAWHVATFLGLALAVVVILHFSGCENSPVEPEAQPVSEDTETTAGPAQVDIDLDDWWLEKDITDTEGDPDDMIDGNRESE